MVFLFYAEKALSPAFLAAEKLFRMKYGKEQVNRYFDSYPPYIKERTDGFVSALKYVLRKKVLRFVKVGNDGTDVWIINNSKRSKISNVEAFQLLNGNWNTIEVITQTELDLIPDTGKELLGWSQE